MDNDEFKSYVTEKLDNISTTVGSLDKKLDLHIQSTVYELKAIHRLDEQQNKLIDQHIEGVKTLKSMIDRNETNNEGRFQKLEEPRKLWSLSVKLFVGVGSVGAAIAAIAAALPYIKAFFQ